MHHAAAALPLLPRLMAQPSLALAWLNAVHLISQSSLSEWRSRRPRALPFSFSFSTRVSEIIAGAGAPSLSGLRRHVIHRCPRRIFIVLSEGWQRRRLMERSPLPSGLLKVRRSGLGVNGSPFAARTPTLGAPTGGGYRVQSVMTKL